MVFLLYKDQSIVPSNTLQKHSFYAEDRQIFRRESHVKRLVPKLWYWSVSVPLRQTLFVAHQGTCNASSLTTMHAHDVVL